MPETTHHEPRPTPEPVPKRRDFFEWLDRLFLDPAGVPDRLEVCIAEGKNGGRVGLTILQHVFTIDASKKSKEGEGEGEANGHSNGKKDKSKRLPGLPSKEELVALSNEISYRCQHEADSLGMQMLYVVLPYCMARGDTPYSRWFVRTSPDNLRTKRGAGGVDDSDEEMDPTSVRAWSIQALQHKERMFNMAAGAIEGAQDRNLAMMDRVLLVNEKLLSALERRDDALEHARRREMEHRWEDVKIKTVERGMDLVTGLAPPLINQLMGRKVLPTTESPESLCLKQFLKLEAEGGKLTEEQAARAFGKFDKEGNQYELGVLTVEQTTILIEVANCKQPADTLDKLIPGGEHAVSQDQLQAMLQIFPMEQIAGVGTLLETRMKQKKSG